MPPRLPVVFLLLALGGAARPAPAPAPGSVTPSGAVVPENLLRIELVLPHALAGGIDMGHVALRDASGVPIDDAFLDLPLPDRDERHVALLMHPGRVKQGIGPNLALGTALRAGGRVTLVIDDPRLPSPIRKTWQVGPALRHAIAPDQWQVAAPPAYGRASLTVTFATPINASALPLLAVATPDGRRLAGHAVLAFGETQWRFVPARPWRPGAYAVRVHYSLEDPAGNRLCAAFEETRQSKRQCGAGAVVPFQVGVRGVRSRSAR